MLHVCSTLNLNVYGLHGPEFEENLIQGVGREHDIIYIQLNGAFLRARLHGMPCMHDPASCMHARCT